MQVGSVELGMAIDVARMAKYGSGLILCVLTFRRIHCYWEW